MNTNIETIETKILSGILHYADFFNLLGEALSVSLRYFNAVLTRKRAARYFHIGEASVSGTGNFIYLCARF